MFLCIKRGFTQVKITILKRKAGHICLNVIIRDKLTSLSLEFYVISTI